jgi:8-oxo-dGTP diphosphatase
MAEKTRSAGGVVLNGAGEVLIVNQYGVSWSFPKGHIDQGEDALTAAKREIHEESGVSRLEYVGDLGSYERYGGKDLKEWKEITLFLFNTDQHELKPIDPNNPEARWVHKDKVLDLLTHPKDKEFFSSIAGRI